MAEVRTSQIVGEVAFEPEGGPLVSQVIGEVAWIAGSEEEDDLVTPSQIEPGKLVGDYYVWLTDQEGNNLALFDDWRNLNINKNLNSPDSIKLVLDGNDPRIDLFELDGQIRVYRKNPLVDLDAYIETEGFIRGWMKQSFENNKKQFTVYTRGWEDLLARRVIAYKSGTINVQKEDAAETVMKEYVKENIGSEALASNGRLRDGVISDLSIEADAGSGVNWSGSRAYKNLLETLIEISNATDLDFRVERTGDASWEFQVGEIGTDRSATDIDASAGTNGAGNSPVVFSENMGTVSEMSYSLRRLQEANVVFALGQGEESLRTVIVKSDDASADDSPYNEREVSRNGSSQQYEYELRAFADKWLEELGPNEEFKFTPRQTKALFYGKHYQVGDTVTAKFDDIVRHKRIVGADITVTSDQPEAITLTFQDIVL